MKREVYGIDDDDEAVVFWSSLSLSVVEDGMCGSIFGFANASFGLMMCDGPAV